MPSLYSAILFFFNDTATTEIYTLSLHDALPICPRPGARVVGRPLSPGVRRGFRTRARGGVRELPARPVRRPDRGAADRKSTRLNSSHLVISYAVFCLKKKNKFTYLQRIISDIPR